MGLFVCDQCNAVENTAYGVYWGRDSIHIDYGSQYTPGTCLCSECTPKVFASGEPNCRGGKWHNRFPKRQWDGVTPVKNRSNFNG